MTQVTQGWLPAGPYSETGNGYRTEFTAREELGYEYSELMVLTSEDGRVFVAISEGCSCSSPWRPEDISEADLNPVHDMAGLTRKLREWNDEPRNESTTSILSPAQFADAVSALADLRLF